MTKAIIILSMLLCLFGPIFVFGFVGYKSIQTLGKRPSKSSTEMVMLVVKLSVTGGVLIGLLALLTKVYSK